MEESKNALETRLQKSVQIGSLLAIYGGLLTKKQQTALRLHYEEDFSLSEIAEQMGTSRQNVHELITRSGQKLVHYEETLGTFAKFEALYAGLHSLQDLLSQIENTASKEETRASVCKAQSALSALIQLQEGEAIDHGI